MILQLPSRPNVIVDTKCRSSLRSANYLAEKGLVAAFQTEDGQHDIKTAGNIYVIGSVSEWMVITLKPKKKTIWRKLKSLTGIRP